MRTTILLVLLCAFQSVAADDAKRIAEAMSPAMRHRIFDGKLIDVGPMAKKAIEGSIPGGDWFLVDGIIGQVVPGGGLLVKDRGKSDAKNPIYVINYPHEQSVVDGDRIKVFTKRSGRFTYNTASGAARTTEAFDCGKLPTPEQLQKLKEEFEKTKADAAKTAEQINDQRRAEWEARRGETEKKAVEFQIKRANEGSAQAQYDLGMRYFNGDGVDVDIEKAVLWLSKAAEGGHSGAKQKISSFFLRYDSKASQSATNGNTP